MEDLLTKLSIVQKELKAPKGQRNSFGNYNYRSAEDILEAVKPLLFEHGLVMTISDKVVHMPSQHKPEQITYKNSKGYDVQDVIGGDRFYVEATVTVYSGTDSLQTTGVARESQYKAGMDDSQITGAASSYARKYALNGMFDIDDTKDADANEHREQVKNTPTAAPKAPQATPAPKTIKYQALAPSGTGQTRTVIALADDELTRAKKAINEELERQGITAPAAKKAKLVSIISKSTIDTLDDCEAVADGLGM